LFKTGRKDPSFLKLKILKQVQESGIDVAFDALMSLDENNDLSEFMKLGQPVDLNIAELNKSDQQADENISELWNLNETDYQEVNVPDSADSGFCQSGGGPSNSQSEFYKLKSTPLQPGVRLAK
jgi:pyruvate formate-lyase activating enzyme-like uncharacterized protein